MDAGSLSPERNVCIVLERLLVANLLWCYGRDFSRYGRVKIAHQRCDSTILICLFTSPSHDIDTSLTMSPLIFIPP